VKITARTCNSSCEGVRRRYADRRRYDSTGHAYADRMITPLLRCVPLAALRELCRGKRTARDETGSRNRFPVLAFGTPFCHQKFGHSRSAGAGCQFLVPGLRNPCVSLRYRATHNFRCWRRMCASLRSHRILGAEGHLALLPMSRIKDIVVPAARFTSRRVTPPCFFQGGACGNQTHHVFGGQKAPVPGGFRE